VTSSSHAFAQGEEENRRCTTKSKKIVGRKKGRVWMILVGRFPPFASVFSSRS
jgi:hypothetical protein